MSATPPEANTEYSRGAAASEPVFAGRAADPPRRTRRTDSLRKAILAAAWIGAALLLVAEFTTLYSVHVAGRGTPAGSEGTGPHHSYALALLAVLAAVLAYGALRTASRPALAAIGAVGVLAMVIALVGDLPDAHAHGITRGFVLASATPAIGLYLETLGAVLLILAGGLGLAALPAGGGAPSERARVSAFTRE